MDYKFLQWNWYKFKFFWKNFKENLLLKHEDVLEAAVIGVKDENRGEIPKAFVVLHENVKDLEQEIKLMEIFEFVNGG